MNEMPLSAEITEQLEQPPADGELQLSQALEQHPEAIELLNLLDDSIAAFAQQGVLQPSVGKASLPQLRSEELLNKLSFWENLLEQPADVDGLVAACEEEVTACDKEFLENLSLAVREIKPLERSYKNLHYFFENSRLERVSNVSFINCSLQQLTDQDNPVFFDFIAEELTKNYDRLDLSENYSLLVLPGYLGGNKIVETWAKIANENKLLLVTDFQHFNSPDDVMEMFADVNLAGGDAYRSNVIMTANWLIGRGRYDVLGEEDHLYVPPSGAIAGRLYSMMMSQVAAGKTFGELAGVEGVAFDMKKSELAFLERMHLVPMVKEDGKVMAYSGKTLFNGNNLGLQTYSVVRVFDYVTKVLIDFLNRRAFENFNANIRKDLMNELVRFLDSITGPEKHLEDFTIQRFEQDKVHKDRLHLDIYLKPYFPAKNFLVTMEGKKIDNGTSWRTSYDNVALVPE